MSGPQGAKLQPMIDQGVNGEILLDGEFNNVGANWRIFWKNLPSDHPMEAKGKTEAGKFQNIEIG